MFHEVGRLRFQLRRRASSGAVVYETIDQVNGEGDRHTDDDFFELYSRCAWSVRRRLSTRVARGRAFFGRRLLAPRPPRVDAPSDGGSPSSLQAATQAFVFATCESVKRDFRRQKRRSQTRPAATDRGAYLQHVLCDDVFQRGNVHASFYNLYEANRSPNLGFEVAPTSDREDFHEIVQGHNIPLLANIELQQLFA